MEYFGFRGGPWVVSRVAMMPVALKSGLTCQFT